MKLENGYQLVYTGKTADGKSTIMASIKPIPTADDKIIEIPEEAKKAKLVYESGKDIKYSMSGIPAETDVTIEALKEIFVEHEEQVEEPSEDPVVEEEPVEEPVGESAEESAE